MWLPLDAELSLRLALVILLLAFGLIRGYYTRKAEAKDPQFMKKRRRKENRKYERRRDVVIQDLAAIAWAIPMLLYILFPSWRTWASISSFFSFSGLAWVVGLVGIGLGAFSLFLLVWVHRTLGEYWTATLEIRSDHKLVTHGPYARIRHPMYTASMLFMFSTGLIAIDWVILAVSAFTLVVVTKRIDNEERLLVEHFGTEYQDYMKRTRRMLPRLRVDTKSRKSDPI